MVKVAFLILAAIAVASAVMVVSVKNVVHSAFSLVVTLFSVGCLFILLRAEFLAATQILIYVGSIMILIIFALMLIDIKEANRQRRFHHQSKFVIGIGIILVIEIILFIIPRSEFIESPEKLIARTAEAGGNIQIIGQSLFTDFIFAFEFASIIILVAIVAAIFLGKQPTSIIKKSSVIKDSS